MGNKFNDINLIREAFGIFLDSNLNVDGLTSFASSNNIAIEDLMFEINRFIKRNEEPCMTLEQRERYLALKPRKKEKDEVTSNR